MKPIRIKDIAIQLGVSPTTVSNVIHGNNKKVSKENIEKIQNKLQEVGYVPSMGARMLAENRSRIIGVLVGSKGEQRRNGQGDAFANIIISALEDEIFKRNYYMLLHLSAQTEENLQLAALWNVEGLITIGLSEQDNVKIQSKCPAPIVSIDNYYGKEAVANIGLNDWQGGYEMGRFLTEQGHKEILFLADNDRGVDHYRWLGFQQSLLENKNMIAEENHWIIPEKPEKRISFYEDNIEKLIHKDALFFASDYYALEAMNFLQDKGVKIPSDISVAGFDDSEYARIARPALTTIRQNAHRKGVAAVEKLFAFIDGKKEEKMQEKLKIELVIRDSVAQR